MDISEISKSTIWLYIQAHKIKKRKTHETRMKSENKFIRPSDCLFKCCFMMTALATNLYEITVEWSKSFIIRCYIAKYSGKIANASLFNLGRLSRF